MKVNLKKGMSLTEVAVALFVIGVVMAMALSFMQSVRETKQIFDMRNDVEAASQKIINYTIENGRLPDFVDFDAMVRIHPKRPIKYVFDSSFAQDFVNRVNSICEFPNSQAMAYQLHTTLSGDPFGISVTNQYDKSVSLNELKEIIGCELGENRLLISTMSLPRVSPRTHYSAEVRALGGRSNYAWCAEIDEDIGGIRGLNPDIFKNCNAPTTWKRMPSATINLPALPKDTLAQTRVITFYVNDNTSTYKGATRKLLLFIDNF